MSQRLTWLQRLLRAATHRPSRREFLNRYCRPSVELLEGRSLLASVGVTASPTTMIEGDTSVSLTFLRSDPMSDYSDVVTFTYTVTGTGANPASTSDHNLSTGGTIQFGIGMMSEMRSIFATEDAIYEGTESFKVEIVSVSSSNPNKVARQPCRWRCSRRHRLAGNRCG